MGMQIGASIGSLFSNIGSTFHANRAAKEKGEAYRNALDYAEKIKQSALSRLDPYADAGTQALSPLTGLLLGKQYDPKTGEYNDITDEQRQALFQKSPGYQFRLEQAQNSLQASQAAKGGLLSGGAMKEMNAYTQGIASDEYGNYINQLGTLAGNGQNAATTQSGIESNTLGQLTGLELSGDRQMINAIQNQNWAGGIMSHHGDMMSILGMGGPNAQGANAGGIGAQGFNNSGGAGGGQSYSPSSGGQSFGASSSSFSGASPGSSSVFSGYNMPNTSLSSGGKY